LKSIRIDPDRRRGGAKNLEPPKSLKKTKNKFSVLIRICDCVSKRLIRTEIQKMAKSKVNFTFFNVFGKAKLIKIRDLLPGFYGIYGFFGGYPDT